MKAFLSVLVIMLVAHSGMSQWRGGDATIMRSDERSLVIEYRPHFLPLQTIREGNIDMTLLDFVGSASHQARESIGSPDLRFEPLPMGFPAGKGNTVQVVSADYEDISNVTLAPVPVVHFDDPMAERREYRMDPEKYAGSTFVPASPAELSGPGRAQTLWVGTLNVYPAQYNPATRILRKYTRLVVEVIFGSPEGTRINNHDGLAFSGTLLNYDVAKNWTFAPPRSSARVSAISSVLATGDWYRIPIVEEGVYVLTPAYLRSLGINTASLDPRTIRIYGNGGTELPEDIQQVRPVDLVENAIYVEGEGDGRFDEGDYALFFARSVRNWTYLASSHTLSHSINHYTEQNYYWLTLNGGSGKRMQTQTSLSDNPVRTPATFLDGVLVEEERINIHMSGKDWCGRKYTSGDNCTYVSPLPGLVADDMIHYTFRLLGASTRQDASPWFSVKEGAHPLGDFAPSSWFGTDPSPFIVNVSGSSNIASSTSRLTFAFQRTSLAPIGWDDWIEIKYPRKFEATGNYLRFRSPDDVTGVVQYGLGQFTTAPFVLNVDRPEDVRRITGVAGSYFFRALETAGQVSEYCVAAAGGFKQPPGGAVRVTNQNLRGDTTDVDFIIVTSPEFRGAADRLKERREQPGHGGLRTRVVDVNQIYNEFGGGIPDVTAIRDYLKHVYDIWLQRVQRQSVFFVLFFGQGSYDYKGLLGSRSSYVPTWQTDESASSYYSRPTDDFFVSFDPPGSLRPSMVTGRLNARTSEEADNFVTKLAHYEDGSARDSWKMRMLFVGDDDVGEPGSQNEGTRHSRQTEMLATDFTPPEFEKRKIYIAEYPTVQDPQGRRKPGAYQAIIDQVNEGVLVTNYTGHGNPGVWAHESIFTVETSIPQLVNSDKLSVFFAATCSFSQFDDPSRRTGSEVLVNKPEGGAIAVVAASREVDSDNNSALHTGVFARMFARDQFGRLTIERPATSLYLYKSVGGNGTDDQKYHFMGDPTMKLVFPTGYASIDSINHQPVAGARQQLKALARVSVQGTIRDPENLPDTTFAGRALLTVNDASHRITIMNFPPGSSWSYLGAGGTIYRGQNSVFRGKFNATFVVPRDILYADSTSFGRIVVYSLGASQASEGAGIRDSISVGGTENGPPDTVGPGMSLYLGTRSFRPGDVVGEDPTLLVDLVDSNGINTSVSGVGHRIEAWVNANPRSRDITEYYSSQLDDFQRGTVECTLKGLRQGKNTVRVRAWDTHNNPSVGETFFDVSSADQLRISDLFNYPNPFSRGTTFTFKQNLLTPITVKVKIYTVAGRLIQTLETAFSGESFVRVAWDGRDRDGAVLANGVYLYKIIVSTIDGRFGSESLGKMAVLK